MKLLLDTNIIIHRETDSVIRDDIGILFYWIDKLHFDKYLHPRSISEIEKHKNPKIVKTFKVKIGAYNTIQAIPPLDPRVRELSEQLDKTDNDRIDTELLNIQYLGITDLFITEDKGLRRKAKLLGVSENVLSIDTFLELVIKEHPQLVDYNVLAVRKKRFGEINLLDPFFDSFREDYLGFDKWFRRKNDENAYVCLYKEEVLAFLYLKIEDPNTEPYSDITPSFKRKKRLKIGTFKVKANGYRLGERFLKIVFDNSIEQKVEEIYVTIFNKSIEQEKLIELFEKFGFNYHGIKETTSGEELVYTRSLNKDNYTPDNPARNYPFIKKDARAFLVPIWPDYHTNLFPDSILRTESPYDFIENEPFRNAISKVYISRSWYKNLQTGDNLVFYRSGGYYKSVITTIGVVEDVIIDIPTFEDFKILCGKRSVFNEDGLRKFWDYYPKLKPFIVNFLYIYSFPKRINLANLIKLGIIKDIYSAPRGFELIKKSDFDTIIEETQTNASIIIN